MSRRGLLTRNDYRLAMLAMLLYAAGRAPFLGQWDSFDYLKQTVTHRLSDLAFGRPVFIGYNVALWETARRLFHLRPTQAETVMMAAVIGFGAAGVLLFARLARQMLPPGPARMATIAFALAPLYAVYAGYIMTEVPMLVALLGCATVLWPDRREGRTGRELAAGLLFGLAAGIREQAITLAPAFAWMLWVRRPRGERFRSLALFGACATVVAAAPVFALCLYDPAAFIQRTRVWLDAIPTGQVHFDRNVQASLLFTLGMAPGAWLGLLAAFPGWHKRRGDASRNGSTHEFSHSRRACTSGILLCLVLPLVVLWRDADVQLHPRYALIVLPAAAVICASTYYRRHRTKRSVLAWGVLQVAVFGTAQLAIMPFRQLQSQKMQFARKIREAVPGKGLIAAGSYSPILDYYRAIGDRPEWRVLWSGWGWRREAAEGIVREAWARSEPVYLCDGPLAWLYFEDERLDLFYIFGHHRSEQVAPGITRIAPLEDSREPGVAPQ